MADSTSSRAAPRRLPGLLAMACDSLAPGVRSLGMRGDRVAYEDAVGEGRAHVFDGDPDSDPARCGEIVLEVTAAPWPERPEEWSEGSLLCPACADTPTVRGGLAPAQS